MALLTGDLLYANFGTFVLPAVASRSYVVYCLAELGDFAEAWPGRRAMRIAEAVERPFSIAGVLILVGLCARRRGDIRQAIPARRSGTGALPDR